MTGNFDFKIISDIRGYLSSRDKTNIIPNVLIRGSKNVYKKKSGNISVRPGLARRGSADATEAGVKSSFEWSNSLGKLLPLRVCNNKLQVESDIVTSGVYIWYDLLDSSLLNPAASLTRFVFDAWWNNNQQKDILLMCRGDSTLLSWSGGLALLASVPTTVSGSVTSLLNASVGSGSGYVAGDILRVTGGNNDCTFRVLSVNGSGAPITFELITVGSGYTTADNVAVTSDTGSGSSFLIRIVAGTVSLITKQGTTAWAEAGFDNSSPDFGVGVVPDIYRYININGHVYNYILGTATTILTVIGDATGEASGSIAIQSVISQVDKPTSGFLMDFLKVIGNQVFVGSYLSRSIYVSSNTDFTNFVEGFDSGDPTILILDSLAKGIGIRNGHAHISAGISDWYEISFNERAFETTTVRVVDVDKKPSVVNSAALAHEFIDTVGNDIIYLDQENQLRVLGDFPNIFQSTKYPSLSNDVEEELRNEDFTGGHLRAIGEIVYISAPLSGRDWMYESRTDVNENGAEVAERFWNPPQIRNISRFAVILGEVFGHSNANPQIYKVWETLQWHDDSPSDDPLPYECVMQLAYQNYGRREGLMKFDMIFIEGYISPGSNLYSNALFDYQGATSLQNMTINTVESPVTLYSGMTPSSIGDATIGFNPLGDGIIPETDEQELLPKFRVITDVNSQDFFEWSIQIYSSDLDCRWEILAVGANPVLSVTKPVNLRK